MVMVRSFVNWAVRKQCGSRHSCRVRRSPGRGVVGLEWVGGERKGEGREKGKEGTEGGEGNKGEGKDEGRGREEVGG